MCRLLLYCLIVSVLCNITCLAEIACIHRYSLNKFNSSIDFAVTSIRNQTGHWINGYSIEKASPTLPTNLKIQVKQSVTAYGDVQYFRLNGVIIVPPTRPADYKLFPGIGYYKFHTEKHSTFDEAMLECAKEGGHLAIINSEAEAKILQNMLVEYINSGKAKHDFAFVGIHDRYKEGDHVTIFGDPLSSTGFMKWYDPRQPDNAFGGEDCGSFHKTGGLNDIGCHVLSPFFCEFDLAWDIS